MRFLISSQKQKKNKSSEVLSHFMYSGERDCEQDILFFEYFPRRPRVSLPRRREISRGVGSRCNILLMIDRNKFRGTPVGVEAIVKPSSFIALYSLTNSSYYAKLIHVYDRASDPKRERKRKRKREGELLISPSRVHPREKNKSGKKEGKRKS